MPRTCHNRETSVLGRDFFDREPQELAIALLGKVLRHRVDGHLWLAARIIETEAYYLNEKGSHSSQGKTESRKAMFMAPGTVYMYYARGADSLNFSAQGDGNGVLVKSAYPHTDALSGEGSLAAMLARNPGPRGRRRMEKLCAGQTLLCRALGLKVVDWNQKPTLPGVFQVEDTGYRPDRIVRCRRLGIPAGRDEHLPYRFVDADWARYCTSNPLTRRGWTEGVDYQIVDMRH